MKKLFFLLFTIPIIAFAQKSNNGRVYDKHPAIETAHKFSQAWISGDTETLKSLAGDGFKMASSMNNSPNYKGGDINNLVGQSSWMKKNFVNISLKDKGQAYSDAIEYKKSGLFVQTFQEFIAWDRNNGFKIRTPFNGIFVFDKKGEKIVRFWWSDNQAAWQKWNLSRETIKNGIVFKDHPFINKLRMAWYNLEQGNIEATFKDYSPNAKIYDSNLIEKDFNSLEEQMENVKNVFKTFDLLSIDEVGFPDYIDYEGSGGVVMSWCNMTMKNKKTGEIKVLKVHGQMSFNDSGSIVRENLYYNSNILN